MVRAASTEGSDCRWKRDPGLSPRLSVCCATADPGARVAEALRPFREVADEIVVAVDSRLDPARLGAYESVADMVVRFEFAPPIERAWSWLSAQMSGDWIFRLDGDEVASPALIAALPRLIEADDVLQYWIPRREVHPDGRRWFDEWPWWPCFINRLVRNDERLHFDGLSHSAAATQLPVRYVEEPFYHLLYASTLVRDRRKKVAYYAGIDPALKAEGSDRLLRHFYLPEDYARLEPVAIPGDDLPYVEAWLRAGDATSPTEASGIRLFQRAEIDGFWAQRRLEESDYRATIEPLSGHRWMRPGEHRPFRVRVRNRGATRWPGGHDRSPLIRLSYRWRNRGGALVGGDGYRSPLPAPLAPGEACIAPVIVAAPGEPGEYVLELDLVHEGVRWFDCDRQVVMRIADERTAPGLAGRIRRRWAGTLGPSRASGIPPEPADELGTADPEASLAVVDRYRWMKAGSRAPLYVLARNVGNESWPGPDRERPIRLGYRWLRPGGIDEHGEGFRTPFPVAITPGAETLVPMVVEAPARPGRYTLEIGVVHEFVRWFACALQLQIDVRAPDPATDLLVPEEAPGWLAGADPDLLDRVTRLCGLQHDEARAMLFRPGVPVDVAIPALGGHVVRVRPATSDVRVIDETFWRRYHLPPPELGVPEVIVDLGSNIGLTMSHFAYLFPDARVAGIELDARNAAICRRNIATWSDRCTVLQAAIWSADGRIAYSREPNEAWAYRVGVEDEGESVMVEAKTLDNVLESVLPKETIDFLKVDIEGAEQQLLETGGEWVERVRVMKVETHEPYSQEACLHDLGRIGFSARPDDARPGAVIACRG